MEYCFHHIPKTAGSTLQLRLAHREHIGQLAKGSTLVVYPLYDGMRFYRVSEDAEFNPDKPIKEAFLRTYKKGSAVGKSNIVCGHYTNISQPGEHITWLRDPLARDVSHFNYDCKYGHELSRDFATHLSQMSGNFLVLWLFGKYIGRHDSTTMEDRYNTVRKVLVEKINIAKKNGCHHVINYTEKNFVEEVEKIVGKNSIDVVYDGVGIKTFKGSIETLKIRGMMVAFGNASGYVDTIDVKKDINAKGLFFTRPSIAHYTVTREELVESAKKVFDAILSAKFKVDISKKYSLQDAAQAHKDLEARVITGPAVIIP